MSHQERTEWFSDEVKPVREGVYEVMFTDGFADSGEVLLSYWTGSHWGLSSVWHATARSNFNAKNASMRQRKWRGLAKKP